MRYRWHFIQLVNCKVSCNNVHNGDCIRANCSLRPIKRDNSTEPDFLNRRLQFKPGPLNTVSILLG